MRLRKPALALLYALFFGLLTSGGNASAQHQNALTPVRVQLKWTHQFQFAGYYAAIDQGYYREAGLDVRLLEYAPGITPIDQLLGGRVEFAVADTGAVIYRSSGMPVVALAAIFQYSPSILISLADQGIQTLADLHGKRIMLAGGYMNAELMSMLGAAGIGSNDFRMIPSETDIDTLVRGETDAYNGYTTNEPYTLAKRGVPFITFHPRDYGVDFYGDLLITTEAMIARNPDLVRAFRDATLKGWAYATANPAAMVELILRDYNSTGKSHDQLSFEASEAIKLILPDLVPIGFMNAARWQRIEQIFREQGLLSTPVDMTQFLYDDAADDSLIETLAQHKLEIAIGVVLVATALLILHILHLRNQVALRTRELEEARHHAEQEARTDVLTGLPNRRCFFEELGRDIAQAERHGAPLVILSIDIDHFKRINDQHGHAAGDEALRKVGALLKKFVRGGDNAARMGGEEFLLSCPNTDIDEARRLAERLRQALENTEIHYKDARFRLTVSIGLARFMSGDDIHSLMRRADQALYRAKQAGRNITAE